jgi:hypothetical protein
MAVELPPSKLVPGLEIGWVGDRQGYVGSYRTSRVVDASSRAGRVVPIALSIFCVETDCCDEPPSGSLVVIVQSSPNGTDQWTEVCRFSESKKGDYEKHGTIGARYLRALSNFANWPRETRGNRFNERPAPGYLWNVGIPQQSIPITLT